MKIRVRGGEATAVPADVLIVPIVAGDEDGARLRAIARRAGGAAFRRAVAAARFRGREAQANVLPLQGPRRQAVALVGLGERAHLDVDAWRRAAGHARHLAHAVGARRVALDLGAHAVGEAHLAAIAEGFQLAGYYFGKYKSAAEVPTPIDELVLIVSAPPAEKALAPLWARIDTTLAGVTLARDLVNEPAAVKTPTYLATVAKQVGKEAGIQVEVWDPKRIAAEKLAGLIAVARGSNEEPRFLRLRYKRRTARSAASRSSARASPSTPAACRSSRPTAWRR